MKKKTVEGLTPAKPKKKGKYITTVQMLDNILILNVYSNRILSGRHCINTKTGEYAQWDAGEKKWNKKKFGNLLGLDMRQNGYYSYSEAEKRMVFNSAKEEETAQKALRMTKTNYKTNAFYRIDEVEAEYSREVKDRTETNRRNRVQDLMGKIQGPPEGIREWIFEKEGAMDFAFWDRHAMKWNCSNCGEQYDEKLLQRTDGEKKIRHNDEVICPACKKIIQAKKRTDRQKVISHFLVFEKLNDSMSVARHFDAKITWISGRKKQILINEGIRIIINKLKRRPKNACEIYYNQYGNGGAYMPQNRSGWDYEYAYFDNKGNPGNRREYTGYLYETGVEEALQDTAYQSWGRLFSQMAAAGKKANYNRLMCTQNDTVFIGMIERLFKGRFDRLLRETAENTSYWSREYCGPLKKNGETIEEVFGIRDRQKINRIRDMDGGEDMLKWMQWSEETGEKITQEALEWLTKNSIRQTDATFIIEQMHIQQIMNYTIRQQAESYKNKSAKAVLEQWSDYLSMCKRLKKNISDEMVYRPKELKRRHDEAITETTLREVELKADEYSSRFPGAEDVLKEIKEKYEYANAEYTITVPQRLIEIVKEGRALHHCAGSSDRYFDRIAQRETYICFLRKTAEPEVPYYTIEVEPGGTIRQHRGYLDEEPDIEQIKPFMREWQKELKKRMDHRDRHFAQISAEKREQNIRELEERNNTRVLQGLMEDFMETI